MPTLTHEAAVAQRFLQNIGVKLVKPETAAPKSEPPAKPQAPIEPKTAAKPDKTNFAQRHSDELDANVEFQMHPDLFDDTPGGWQNVQLVLDYIKEHHDGYPSRASVSDAISTLRRSGDLLTLFRPEPPAKQPEPQAAVVRVQKQQQAPPPDPEAGLPPLPDFVKRALGSNKLLTRRDVHAIPTQLYSDLYRGPFAEAFRKRVNAALAR